MTHFIEENKQIIGQPILTTVGDSPIIKIDSEVIIIIIKTRTIAGFLEFFNSI